MEKFKTQKDLVNYLDKYDKIAIKREGNRIILLCGEEVEVEYE